MPYMADRCRIVIEAVLKYAQELLECNSNTNLSADLKVLPHSHQGHALRLLNWLRKLMGIFEGFRLLLADADQILKSAQRRLLRLGQIVNDFHRLQRVGQLAAAMSGARKVEEPATMTFAPAA